MKKIIDNQDLKYCDHGVVFANTIIIHAVAFQIGLFFQMHDMHLSCLNCLYVTLTQSLDILFILVSTSCIDRFLICFDPSQQGCQSTLHDKTNNVYMPVN